MFSFLIYNQQTYHSNHWKHFGERVLYKFGLLINQQTNLESKWIYSFQQFIWVSAHFLPLLFWSDRASVGLRIPRFSAKCTQQIRHSTVVYQSMLQIPIHTFSSDFISSFFLEFISFSIYLPLSLQICICSFTETVLAIFRAFTRHQDFLFFSWFTNHSCKRQSAVWLLSSNQADRESQRINQEKESPLFTFLTLVKTWSCFVCFPLAKLAWEKSSVCLQQFFN